MQDLQVPVLLALARAADAAGPRALLGVELHGREALGDRFLLVLPPGPVLPAALAGARGVGLGDGVGAGKVIAGVKKEKEREKNYRREMENSR